MGDRHGDCFARRGRALNPPRPQVDAHRGVNFRWRATAFRCRGVVGRIYPRRNALLGKGLPTRREGERICAAQEHAPRRRSPDTARRRKDLPRAGTRPSAKASRHGARAKEFAPRRNALLDEGLPTRREGERICPAQEHAPQRRHPDTARSRRDLPRVRTLPTAKASRHGARAKGFAPREKTLLGEGLPTRRTGERICPTRERSPRRRPPDTAHERKDLPRARTLSSTKASRHSARAKGFVPRRNTPLSEGLPTRRTSEGICPAGFAFAPRADERRATLDRRTAEKHPFGGVAPTACGRCRVHSPKKIRLLHETQLFYGESHVGSR